MRGNRAAVAATFVVALVGCGAVRASLDAGDGSWILLGLVGLAAGALGGQPSRVWAALAGYGLAEVVAVGALGQPLGPFWYLVIAGRLVTLLVTFVAGTALASRPRPVARPWRLATTGIAAVTLLAVVGYGGYAALRSAEYLTQEGESDCRTPMVAFGWAYDAINYDKADDARLMAVNPDPRKCVAHGSDAAQGSRAGSELVAADGTRIAGWYIPAANDATATGPTLVLVHGGKDNKSGMLKYAVPLHTDYNLVLIDLRNQGRSTGDASSGGLREALDLRAMIDWLERTKHPAWLAVVGNSNGAATALVEALDDPRPQALILDSMHASAVTQLGNIIETEQHLPAWPAAWAFITGASIRLGADITAADPVRTIGRVGDRPVLLLHGLQDHVDRPADSLERNVEAAIAAGVNVEVHVCPTADHGAVIDRCPLAWAAWAADFLAAARGVATP